MATQRARDITDAIGHMRPEHLLCRDHGHVWKPFNVETLPRRAGYIQTLRCGRCTMERARYVDRDGYLSGNRYTRPDGYVIAGLGNLTPDDKAAIRLASIEQTIRGER